MLGCLSLFYSLCPCHFSVFELFYFELLSLSPPLSLQPWSSPSSRSGLLLFPLSSCLCSRELQKSCFTQKIQDSAWVRLRQKWTPRALKAAENIPSSYVQPSLLPKYSLSKTKKNRWWKNYIAKPQHIQKIPQSSTVTLLPCIIDPRQLSSPMDSTWNDMMKLDRMANIFHNGMYNGMSNAILMRDSKWFSIK